LEVIMSYRPPLPRAESLDAHFHGKEDAMLAAIESAGAQMVAAILPAYRRIRDSGPESLPGLAPLCTYIALSPFIGPEEACRVANGDGRGRSKA
jgi:hypothetical protein